MYNQPEGRRGATPLTEGGWNAGGARSSHRGSLSLVSRVWVCVRSGVDYHHRLDMPKRRLLWVIINLCAAAYIYTRWYLEEWKYLSRTRRRKKIFYTCIYIYYQARCKYIYIKAQMAEITTQLLPSASSSWTPLLDFGDTLTFPGR